MIQEIFACLDQQLRFHAAHRAPMLSTSQIIVPPQQTKHAQYVQTDGNVTAKQNRFAQLDTGVWEGWSLCVHQDFSVLAWYQHRFHAHMAPTATLDHLHAPCRYQ